MRRSGPFPAACLGVGEAKAREIREARAKNLDIIRDSAGVARDPKKWKGLCIRFILQEVRPGIRAHARDPSACSVWCRILPARAARGAETPSVRIVLIISLPAPTRHHRVIAPVRLARSDLYSSPCRQSVAELKQTAIATLPCARFGGGKSHSVSEVHQ
jgi:hypothetical protein